MAMKRWEGEGRGEEKKNEIEFRADRQDQRLSELASGITDDHDRKKVRKFLTFILIWQFQYLISKWFCAP